MESDRTELDDQSQKYPERARAMAQTWERWAVMAKAKPWPWER